MRLAFASGVLGRCAVVSPLCGVASAADVAAFQGSWALDPAQRSD